MVSLNKDKEARELYSEALRRYEAAPAGENTRKANVLLSLFILDEKTGRKEEAESLLRQARRLSEGQPGDEGELQYADFLLRLGRIRRQRGMVDEAEEYFREAAGIYSRFLSELYYLAGYASVLLDLALCAAERGRLTSADECFDQAISEYIRGFGSEHPNLGQVLHIQALFWTEHGLHREKSAAQLERAVRILSESLGDEHQWTRAARQDLRQFDPAQH
jgi:tetratricopeptide (TPR) repeat protein